MKPTRQAVGVGKPWQAVASSGVRWGEKLQVSPTIEPSQAAWSVDWLLIAFGDVCTLTLYRPYLNFKARFARNMASFPRGLLLWASRCGEHRRLKLSLIRLRRASVGSPWLIAGGEPVNVRARPAPHSHGQRPIRRRLALRANC